MKEIRENKGKRSTIELQIKSIPWNERKCLADRDEEALKQEIEDLNTWVLYYCSFNFQLYFTLFFFFQ